MSGTYDLELSDILALKRKFLYTFVRHEVYQYDTYIKFKSVSR